MLLDELYFICAVTTILYILYIHSSEKERERGGTGNEEASAGNSADSGRGAALAVEKINKRGEIEKREEEEKKESEDIASIVSIFPLVDVHPAADVASRIRVRPFSPRQRSFLLLLRTDSVEKPSQNEQHPSAISYFSHFYSVPMKMHGISTINLIA